MLGVVAIVRDEAAVIERCLRSAIDAGVEVATIVDTGSTDGTPELVGRMPLDVRLHHRPFVDFGTTRSEAFALARGSADWLLALDADMTVTVDRFDPDPTVDAYTLDMGGDGFSNRLPLLLRGDREWMSVGPVHEYTCLRDGSLGRRLPTDAVRITQPGAAWTEERARRDVALLEAAVRTPRTVFYLARTYDELGDPRARDLYAERVAMGGWDQEVYYAAYRGALLEDWPERQAALTRAWELRPTRLEALHALARELNERGQHQTAYLLSSVSVPSCDDELFIHRWVWDWGLLFERQIAAWWVGAPTFAAITDRLLTLELPSHIRSAVERNASLRAA